MKEIIDMTDAEICFQWRQFVVQGHLVQFFDCLEEHGSMHPFFDHDLEAVVFECLACNYTVKPGYDMLERMRIEVEKVWQSPIFDV
jgi:hypothetical protein